MFEDALQLENFESELEMAYFQTFAAEEQIDYENDKLLKASLKKIKFSQYGLGKLDREDMLEAIAEEDLEILIKTFGNI